MKKCPGWTSNPQVAGSNPAGRAMALIDEGRDSFDHLALFWRIDMRIGL
jgi:hypothetical protein